MIIPSWLINPHPPNWTMTCSKHFCGFPLLTELNRDLPAHTQKRPSLPGSCHFNLSPATPNSSFYIFTAACRLTWNQTVSCFHSFADAVLPKRPLPSFFANSYTTLTQFRCYSFDKHLLSTKYVPGSVRVPLLSR